MKFLSFLLNVLSFCSFTQLTNIHVLVIAPPMFGHMIPSLELAKQLSNECHVTYLIPTYKIRELEHKGLLPVSNEMNNLDIVGLNDGNEESIEFKIEDAQINRTHLIKAVPNDRQQVAFNTILNRMGAALNELLNSGILFCSPSTSGNCSLKSSAQPLTTRLISKSIDMIIIRSFTPFPLFHGSIPVQLFLPGNLRGVVNSLNTRKMSPNESAAHVYLRKNINRADRFICNSLKEFDEKYVDEFHRLTGTQAPIHFVGPIVLNGQQSVEEKEKEILHWLDAQPVASVIYLAFGSIAQLPSTVIETIAHTLTNYSFIWSLKTKTSLPQSLTNLDSNHQLILEWTPQRAILAHPSVSIFFSHGGWNSLLEGMLHGKAMLIWPLFADQFENSLQLVEMGVARQVSQNLTIDIEHMLANRNYTDKAKEIQQMIIKAREDDSKKELMNIIRSISKRSNGHDEF